MNSYEAPICKIAQKIETNVRLEGIGDTWQSIKESGWKVGQKLYKPSINVLEEIAEVDERGKVLNYCKIRPELSKNVLYFVDQDIYMWNENTLICKTNEIKEQLNESIEDIEDTVDKHTISIDGGTIDAVNVEQGAINSTGQEISSTTRIRTTTKFYSTSLDATFKMRSSVYGIRVFEFNTDGALVKYLTYDTAGTESITFAMASTDDYLRLVFIHQDGSDINVDELGTISLTYSHTITPDTKEAIDGLENRVSKIEKNKFQIDSVEVEQGSINISGVEFTSLERIRTTTKFTPNNIDLHTYSISNSAYKFRLFEYDGDDAFLKYIGEFTSKTNYAVDTLGNYIRVVFLNADGSSAINPSEYSEIGFSYNTDNITVDTKEFESDFQSALKSFLNENIETSTCNLNGKIVAFIGDSITASGSPTNQNNLYHKVFAKLSGCTSRNLGQWNTTIARDADNITETAQPFITRVTEENLSDVDMVVVFGGINDYRHDNLAIGDAFTETESGGVKTKTPNSNTNCFAGAMHELITTIRSIVPRAPIIFMTPLMGVRGSDLRTNTISNSHGDYLEDFRKCINEVCEYYMVPVFNVDKVFNFDPTNETINTTYYADGLHPNDAGHIYLGKLLYKFVMSNIALE